MGRPRLRLIYLSRFMARCIVLLSCMVAYLDFPAVFAVLQGRAFFQKFSALHLLWAAWMGDMLAQIFPIGKNIALGSLKLFRTHFRPLLCKLEPRLLKDYITRTSRDAYLILLLWVVLTATLGLLRGVGLLNDAMLFLVSAFFYVCDLICVLFWCPFRVFIMKNRCCTTCRIFNWDHLMMFSPLIFVRGFYSWSLVAMAALVFLVWEFSIYLHPERFWECTNRSLRCAECTDKLCPESGKGLR